jgi:hypothetical protein
MRDMKSPTWPAGPGRRRPRSREPHGPSRSAARQALRPRQLPPGPGRTWSAALGPAGPPSAPSRPWKNSRLACEAATAVTHHTTRYWLLGPRAPPQPPAPRHEPLPLPFALLPLILPLLSLPHHRTSSGSISSPHSGRSEPCSSTGLPPLTSCGQPRARGLQVSGRAGALRVKWPHVTSPRVSQSRPWSTCPAHLRQ